MKKILVTGASGFIGRHLLEELSSRGYELRALVRSYEGARSKSWLDGIDLVIGDVEEKTQMMAATKDVDTIFHLASKVHEVSKYEQDRESYYSVNVNGTHNLLKAAEASGVKRFIFFSSVKAMGEETKGCADESTIPRPATPYGASKLEAENLVLRYAENDVIHAACLRLPLVYGEGNKGNLIKMISAIDKGRFPPLPNLKNVRSLVHVKNVVQAAIVAALNPNANGKRYIVTDSKSYTTRELYNIICSGLNKKTPVWHLPLTALKAIGLAGDVIGWLRRRRFMIDSKSLDKIIGMAYYCSDKISEELGYQSDVTFEEALPELISWYRRDSV